MTAKRVRDVVDRDFIALVDRAASEAAYRLGGTHRALRGVRPSARRRFELVIVAGLAGFVGVVAVLTARRWTAKIVELIQAMEDAELERLRAAQADADGAEAFAAEPDPDESPVGAQTPPDTEP